MTTKIPVVIIPGIMGTYLLQQQPAGPQLLWIDPALAWMQPDDRFLNALQLDEQGNSQGVIYPQKIFDGTYFFKNPSETDHYGHLLTFLRSQEYIDNKTLFTFPYDWRLSNDENARYLDDFLAASAIPHSPNGRVDIIAHSMGGLIARSYAAQYGSASLNKIIYVGTPHEGSANSYGTLAFNNALNKAAVINKGSNLPLRRGIIMSHENPLRPARKISLTLALFR